MKDVVQYRTSPVLLDNFARADSTTLVGNAPIGGTPTAVGTRGIKSTAAVRWAYVATPVSGGQNLLTWESNSCDVLAECEFQPGATANCGLVLRYVDSSNYLVLNYKAATTSVNIYKVVAGTFTQLKGIGGITVPQPGQGRLGAFLRRDLLWVYMFDRLIGV